MNFNYVVIRIKAEIYIDFKFLLSHNCSHFVGENVKCFITNKSNTDYGPKIENVIPYKLQTQVSQDIQKLNYFFAKGRVSYLFT